MTFLFVPGLFALLSLLVVLWLHLRRSKLKRIVVPSLLLWHHLPISSVQRRRWLPITPLLLLHLLIAALLSLALARPQRSFAWLLKQRTHTAIIVDSSTSMQARDTASGSRYDEARARVRSVVDNMSGRDRVSLIMAGPPARLLASGDISHHETLLGALDDVTVGGNDSDIAGALLMAQTALDADEERQPFDAARILVLSDLEQPPDLAATSGTPLEWQRIGGAPGNRAIVAFAARARGGNPEAGAVLYARVANYSNESLTTRLRLFADDNLMDTRMVALNPDGNVGLTWNLPPEVRVVRAELEGQDPLPIDDQASLSLRQIRPLNTLLVSAQPAALEQALRAVPGLNVVAIPAGAYASSPLAATADLVVFDGTLTETLTWPAGGVLVVNPPATPDATLLTAAPPQPLPPQPAGALRYNESESAAALLDGLNLGSVDFGDVPRLSVPPWATVVLAAGDVPLMLRGQQERSDIAIWSFDLARSNLPTRLAFPLLVARTVRDLAPDAPPATLAPGERALVDLSPRAEQVELLTPDNQRRTLASGGGQRTAWLDTMHTPGLYTLVEHSGTGNSDDDVLYEGYIAVNAGSPLEADLRPHPAHTRNPLLSTAGQPAPPGAAEPRIEDEEQPLWPWLALAALLVLTIEWVSILFRKKRTV